MLLFRGDLDIGSGSGLFSLAARRLGARVVSFDYDPESVACTQYLSTEYYAGDPDWRVETGSVLDSDFIESLGQFDVVYSWGVLHHTGQMWKAIDNASRCVKPGGRFFFAIYNDQGVVSQRWRRVKQTFCKTSPPLKSLMLLYYFFRLNFRSMIRGAIRLRPLAFWRDYQPLRGMSRWHDLRDWVGGLPFEVASPGALLAFCRERGFALEVLESTNSLGCNQLVFRKLS